MASPASPVRRVLITLLDVAIALAAGIGLLLRLGVRGKLALAGISVTPASSWRPLAAAGILLIVRLLVGRTSRVMPGVVDQDSKPSADGSRIPYRCRARAGTTPRRWWWPRSSG